MKINSVRRTNAQSSVEYLMIFGLVMLLIVPALYFFYSSTREITYTALTEQLNVLGNNILENVNYVYPYGSGSKTTIDAEFPSNVKNIRVLSNGASNPGTELIIEVDFEGKTHSLVFFGKYNMGIGGCAGAGGTFSPATFSPNPEFFKNPGKKKIRILSCGSAVAISEAT